MIAVDTHLYTEVPRKALDTVLQLEHCISPELLRVLLDLVCQANLHSVHQVVHLVNAAGGRETSRPLIFTFNKSNLLSKRNHTL